MRFTIIGHQGSQLEILEAELTSMFAVRREIPHIIMCKIYALVGGVFGIPVFFPLLGKRHEQICMDVCRYYVMCVLY